jgi:glycosyltransferase involved in cell wall biosynthesis
MRADIVIGANEGRATGISLICAIILRRKFISWIHCDWGEFRKYVSWRTLCALQISRWSDKIVVVSIGAMDSFMRIVAVSKDKVTCIPNAIDVAEVLARANESMQEEDRHIFRDPTIVSVGRLNTQKNHQFLIRSHAMLRQRGIWQRLVIVGQGDLKDSLMTLARELSVADTVHLIGFRSNPYPYIAAGTVFAFTSLFEGMGIVLIEATVIGTGVVSINCPSGPSEVLAGGQLGVLVPPNDLALFSDEIARFIVNPAHKENFRRADVNNSIRFDIPQLISSWERVLEQVYAL